MTMARQSRAPTILLTRPQAQSRRFAQELRQVTDLPVLIAPLMEAHVLAPDLPKASFRAVILTSETGAWAWLRLVRKGQLSATTQSDLFNLRLGLSGFSASFELRAGSVDNPFDLKMFGNFKCPTKF